MTKQSFTYQHLDFAETRQQSDRVLYYYSVQHPDLKYWVSLGDPWPRRPSKAKLLATAQQVLQNHQPRPVWINRLTAAEYNMLLDQFMLCRFQPEWDKLKEAEVQVKPIGDEAIGIGQHLEVFFNANASVKGTVENIRIGTDPVSQLVSIQGTLRSAHGKLTHFTSSMILQKLAS